LRTASLGTIRHLLRSFAGSTTLASIPSTKERNYSS
jgi:hypothetical protein